MEKFIVRKIERKDIPTLHVLINGLAEHEKRPQDVTGSNEKMEYWIFDRKIANAFLAELDGKAIGYAIYYPIYGSYAAVGRAHLEDIFIAKDFRGKGFGTKFLGRICEEILSEGYVGLEWNALDYNDEAIEYYRHLNAEQETNRLYFSFDENQIREMAKKNSD